MKETNPASKTTKSLTPEDIQKLADNMQLQMASITVTLPEPPNSHAEVPAFMQHLIDALFGAHLALRESGSEAVGMKAVKFTPSAVAPDSGRGDLEIHIIRAKTQPPLLHSLN